MNEPDPIERDRQARDIFLRAAERPSAEARDAYLAEACGSDEALRSRVLKLLESHRQDSFLEGPAVDLRPITEELGDRVGRYKLLQQIGEGGMGVVYMAEQEEPVRRRVALKVIKLGMDTRQVVARFEAERQALALMDHPNIARVLDAGATDAGRPYFVMELVQGVPITEFCDKNQLSTEQRLKLFIPVCQAIQSAHQKGIIHRDLKPTNILVSLNPDGSGLPKIIDFGVAKATSQKLTEKTLFTAHGMMVGTPAYMSPEQAEMSPLDVDTRADIYSLGALLYELLTGTTPFPEQRLCSAGYNEIQRIILEEEPETPSIRLGTLQGEQRSIVARNRGASELTLGGAFSTDLDWIVMKCLEKDRARRYETANGLARDIERHLGNEPVTARPPSRLYEFQKTLRRHWVGFTAAGAILASIAIGAVSSTLEAVRARRAGAASQQSLYNSLVAQARATRLARRVGYRDQVFALLSQAKTLDVPERNLADLRKEAIACLGDFIGLTPTTLTNAATNFVGACLGPSGGLVAFSLADGTVELRDMPSGKEKARFNCTNGLVRDLGFNNAGDELFALTGHFARNDFSETLASGRICTWAQAPDGRWRQTENRIMQGSMELLYSESGVFDVVIELRAEEPGPVIGKIMPGGPAAKSHLEVGDRVVAYGGIALGPTNWFPTLVRKHGGQPTTIVVERDSQRVELAITPEVDPATRRSFLGIVINQKPLQAVFRLLNVKTGAFVPEYAVTNTDWHGAISYCASENRTVLAFATGPSSAPNYSSVINLYDWRTGARLNQLHQTSLGIPSLSEDGKYFASASGDADIYSLPGLERMVHFGGTSAAIAWHLERIVFSRNLAAVPIPRQNHIRLWNLVSREEVGRLDEPGSSFVLPRFALNGTSLVTLRDQQVRWYRLSTPEKLNLPGHSAGAGPFAFSPDGTQLASVADRVLRVCDASSGRTAWETNDLPGPGKCVSYSPDGRWLAVGHWDTELVCVRDARTGQRLLELGTNGIGRSWSVPFSPDGHYLATATEPYGLRIWTIEPGDSSEPRRRLEAKLVKSWKGVPTPNPALPLNLPEPTNATPISVAFALDSRSLAFWCINWGLDRLAGSDGSLYVWDFNRSAEPHTIAPHFLAHTQCESFTPDGHSLLAVATNGIVVAVDVSSGKQSPRKGMRDMERDYPGLCLSPDGSKLAVSTGSGLDLRIRDPSTGNLLFSLPPESGQIAGFAWSPDSRRLAISRDNGNIAIWDLEKVDHILAELGLSR